MVSQLPIKNYEISDILKKLKLKGGDAVGLESEIIITPDPMFHNLPYGIESGDVASDNKQHAYFTLGEHYERMAKELLE